MGGPDTRRLIGRWYQQRWGAGGTHPLSAEVRRFYWSCYRLLGTFKGPRPVALFKSLWIVFWMRWAGRRASGRLATRLATWLAPPHRARRMLALLYPAGYIAPGATIDHDDLRLGANVFVGDRVVIHQDTKGGPVELGERVRIYGDSYLETGHGGHLTIGADTYIQPRCQLMAYVASIEIGREVAIAQNCAFYPYDHGIEAGAPIGRQSLQSKGGILIGDGAWLGTGVIVLSGVRIGKGAVIGAGSVVTRDIPDGAVAVGVPARVVKMRYDAMKSPADSSEE